MNVYLVTVRLPRNPDHMAFIRCDRANNHPRWPSKGGHCDNRGCPNYSGKCPRHSDIPDGIECTREKKTGICPIGLGYCTDVTGEHHTFVADVPDEIQARQLAEEIMPSGAHITRIELGRAE